MAVLELFDTRYGDFGVKHLHETLVAEHGLRRSYNWLRITLQAHGRIRPAPRRGAHRRKRPRRPMKGMMLHQDGSRHQWIADETWDLIVTMDDATSEIYSAFFVAEEGTMSTFRGLHAVIAGRGLFCSLYADRGSHDWHTPAAGGKVDKDNPTQVGRALAHLGIELIPAYSPEARGRSERMFGTLQKRLPQELRVAGITTMEAANRFLENVYLPRHNAAFARTPEDAGSAFVPFAGLLEDILCVQEERRSATTIRCGTRTASCRSPPTATVTTTSRRRCGFTSTRTARSPSSTVRGVWRDIRPQAHSWTKPINRRRETLRRRLAHGFVDNAAALPTTPQAPQPQQKRSIHMVVLSGMWLEMR